MFRRALKKAGVHRQLSKIERTARRCVRDRPEAETPREAPPRPLAWHLLGHRLGHRFQKKTAKPCASTRSIGEGAGIRTHGTVTRTTVFEF